MNHSDQAEALAGIISTYVNIKFWNYDYVSVNHKSMIFLDH